MFANANLVIEKKRFSSVQGPHTALSNKMREEIDIDGCADRLEKDASYRQQMSEKVHSKVDLDRLKSENLGEVKCCNQPLQLRKEGSLRNVEDQTSACTSFPSEATSRIFLAVQLAQIHKSENGR